ncbi:MAG: phenylacetate--CoA ligase [Planctomycetota bacterium]|jgi:phenylacetate-CoA ligase|nr:phenylacetate--CoA ligase [Planctomycetota bacterium]
MDYNMYQPDLETMSRDQIAGLQLNRLQKIARHVYEKNPAYRKRFDEAGIHPEDIRELGDVKRLPTMDKEDMRLAYPAGLLCEDMADIREMHMSSGSTGTPIAMLYTQHDLDQWADCMARCYRMAGCREGDPVQITPSFGLFNGGFGMYHGARKAGLFILPTGAGNTARQIQLARDFGTRVITGVVSYGIRILEELARDADKRLPKLEIGIFGAETFSDSMRKTLKDGLHIEPFDIYGMTETGGVGTLGQDCRSHSGIHVWEDHYLIEVLDPATRAPVPDGLPGELYVTALSRQAVPVIRFRKGDITRVLSRDLCSCGRFHVRIAPITGRVDDMLIIKGINFFPSQVEQALMEIPGVLPNYQIIITEQRGVKDVRINVEADGSVTGFTVEKHLKERLGFSPKGDVFPAGGLPRQEGKAKRVFYEKDEG